MKTGQLEARGSSLSTIPSGEKAPYTSRICLWRAQPHSLLSNLPAALPSFHHCVLGGLSERVPSSPRRVTPALSFVSGHVEAALSRKEDAHLKGQINVASSDSEVEIVGVQEKAR